MFVQVSKEDHFKDALEDNVSTHMLGEEQPVCWVKTIEHPKTQKADQSQSVELSSTPLLPSVASSLEHDVVASIE
jgi:hypothetical protein